MVSQKNNFKECGKLTINNNVLELFKKSIIYQTILPYLKWICYIQFLRNEPSLQLQPVQLGSHATLHHLKQSSLICTHRWQFH